MEKQPNFERQEEESPEGAEQGPEAERGPETEEKKVVNIERSSEDGLMILREKYDNDSVGPWNYTGIETNDRRAMDTLVNTLRRDRKLPILTSKGRRNL